MQTCEQAVTTRLPTLYPTLQKMYQWLVNVNLLRGQTTVTRQKNQHYYLDLFEVDGQWVSVWYVQGNSRTPASKAKYYQSGAENDKKSVSNSIGTMVKVRKQQRLIVSQGLGAQNIKGAALPFAPLMHLVVAHTLKHAVVLTSFSKRPPSQQPCDTLSKAQSAQVSASNMLDDKKAA